MYKACICLESRHGGNQVIFPSNDLMYICYIIWYYFVAQSCLVSNFILKFIAFYFSAVLQYKLFDIYCFASGAKCATFSIFYKHLLERNFDE